MDEMEELTEEQVVAMAEQAAESAEQETDPEQICFYLRQAVKNYAAAGEKYWRKQLLYLRKLAVQKERQEKYDEALEYRSRTVELVRSIPSPTKTETCLLAEMYTYRGLTYYNMQKYAEERQDYDQAIALRKKVGNFGNNYCDLSIVYCNYADTLLKQEDVQGALAQYQAAEKIARKYIRWYPWRRTTDAPTTGYDNKSGLICLARAQLERAEHLKGRKEWRTTVIESYTSAIQTYRKLLKRNTLTKEERAEAMEFLAVAYNGRGVCYYAQQQYQKEIQDCSRALSLRRKMEQTPENQLQSIVVCRNQCDCFELLENPKKAAECCKKALNIADQLEKSTPGRFRREERIDLLICYAGNLDGCGNYEAAREGYTQALELLAQEEAEGRPNGEYTALCHFRRGLDLSRSKHRLYGEGLIDYGRALQALDSLEQTPRISEFRIRILRTRGDLAFAMGFHSMGDQDFTLAAELEAALPKEETPAS